MSTAIATRLTSDPTDDAPVAERAMPTGSSVAPPRRNRSAVEASAFMTLGSRKASRARLDEEITYVARELLFGGDRGGLVLRAGEVVVLVVLREEQENHRVGVLSRALHHGQVTARRVGWQVGLGIEDRQIAARQVSDAVLVTGRPYVDVERLASGQSH